MSFCSFSKGRSGRSKIKSLKNKIFEDFSRRRKTARARKEITSSSSLLRRRLDDCLLPSLLSLSLGWVFFQGKTFSSKKLSTTLPPPPPPSLEPELSGVTPKTVPWRHHRFATRHQNGTRKKSSSFLLAFYRAKCHTHVRTHENSRLSR